MELAKVINRWDTTYDKSSIIMYEVDLLSIKENNVKQSLVSFVDQLAFEKGLAAEDRNYSFILSTLENAINTELGMEQVLFGNNEKMYARGNSTKSARKDGAIKMSKIMEENLEYFRKKKNVVRERFENVPFTHNNPVLDIEEIRSIFDKKFSNEVTISGGIIKERDEGRL